MKSEFKHTEGDWVVNTKSHKHYTVEAVKKDSPFAIAITPCYRPEDLANAYLIAAAPRLLRELQELRKSIAFLPQVSPSWKISRLAGADAAIKQALNLKEEEPNEN